MKSIHYLCALGAVALLIVTGTGVVIAAPASVPPPSVAQISYIYHTVQPGENLYRISLRYSVSMYAIMQANGISNPNRIYVGQVLRIPTGSGHPPAPPPPPGPVPPPAPHTGFYYTVVYGDTLGAIAARFGTTIYAIMQANGIVNPNCIYRGQVLWIPTACCQPQPPVYGNWRGEYFNNENLAGTPVIRYDAEINFDWGWGPPHPQIGADRFSVRWTRSLWLGTGTWRFTTTTDDGVRLYVDNTLVIDQWKEQPATTYSADVSLNAGYHNVRMEYFELTGLAVAHLNWASVSDGGAPGAAWLGEYYDNMFLSGSPTFTRFDPAIDFDWGNGSPGSGVPNDLWSARWTQTANFAAGTYRFHIIVDDGVRLFIDGQVVIDEWRDNAGTEFIRDKSLSSGNHTLKVEYYEKGYQAKIRFWWEKLS